ncbi:bifunctional [glutamine synthetase] adenylyltransferase/[glutamine synthetase]-adenylyl-L-tyrosine phosphorylase [Paracoccaceae bacterium GXU_MW_L88]
MSLADRLTRCPIPFDEERGKEAGARFGGQFGDLVAGAAGCSPYLAQLIRREGDWLEGAADDPEAALAAELADLSREEEAALSTRLREAKRRVALIAALADLGGVWSLEEVTGALSDLADGALKASLNLLISNEIKRGKLPGMEEGDDPEKAGLVPFAMGKMGARELNYSSDIDIIMLFDQDRFPPEEYLTARKSFIRVVQKTVKLLSEVTGEGYVFRTDLRLRPDPAVTPVVMGMDPAESYYESLGRNWERAAWIKARPAAGDLEAGAEFIQRLRPFIWRRHLDFAAIEDTHDMRLRIRSEKGLHGPITLPGHHLKLGRGGIREIEFFTQTRQLIAGGRDPDLRMRETVPALQELAVKKWISTDISEKLITHYRFLREMEHRMQMFDDAQTHLLPGSEEGFARLAAFCGEEDVDAFKANLQDHLQEVHDIAESFYRKERGTPEEGATATESFEDPEKAETLMASWNALPAFRSDRARRIFERIQPRILELLGESDAPDDALLQLDRFFKALPAGVQIFSLFEAAPQILDLLIEICGTAPRLATYLGQRPQVLDAVVTGQFFAPLEGAEALAASLKDKLSQEDDYERRLDALRRWVKDHHFRTGVLLLRGIVSAEEAARSYSDIATVAIRGIAPEVEAEFSRRHGPPPGLGWSVVAMGKLGSGEMTAQSDLDLIIIYDPEDAEASDGKKPLAITAYYARLTQALVNALTVATAEGPLYEVDMRLRPSGKQGPVAIRVSAFESYQKNEAWSWEHMALTRAAILTGPDGLKAKIQEVVDEVLSKDRDRVALLKDVQDMRGRLAEAHPEEKIEPFEIKYGSGRLMDVELLLQTGHLLTGKAEIDAQAEAGFITAEDANTLSQALDFYRKLQQIVRITANGALNVERLGTASRNVYLERFEAADMDALAAQLADHAQAARAVIEAKLAP